MKLMNGARAVGLAFIAMALLAPAIAQGTETWWFDHEEGRYPIPFDEKGVSPKFFGFALTNEAKTVKLGPCEDEGVGLAGELHNKYGGMGEGTFTEKSVTKLNKNCPTEGIEGGCEVSKVEPTDFPWQVTLTTSGTVTISNVNFTIELVGECKNSPIPKESKASGKLEGTFDNFKMEGEKKVQGKVTFSHSGGLKVGEVKLFLDGYLQFGTEFTVKKEPTGFAPEYSPAKIDGNQLEPFKFTRGGRTVECKTAKVEGTAKDRDTTLTITPTYTNCTAAIPLMGNVPATITMNGCDYLLHLEAVEDEGAYKYTAPTDLKCPAGKEVEVHVYSNHTNHTASTFLCRYNLGETGNQGLELVQLTNQEPEAKVWIKADVNMAKIKSKRTSGSALVCGNEIDEAGTLTGTYDIRGTTDSGEGENGISVFPP
jgi:hypothetical protein